MKKKILLFILAFAMLFTSLVTTSYADEPAGEGEGEGETTIECDCPVHNPDAKVPSLECSNEERVVNIASEAVFTVSSGTGWHLANYTADMVDGDWHVGTLGNNQANAAVVTAVFNDPNFVTDINIVVNSFGINLVDRPWDTVNKPTMTEVSSDIFPLYLTLYTWDEDAQTEKVMDAYNKTKLTWTGDQQVVTVSPNARITKIEFTYAERQWNIHQMIWEVEVFSTEVSHIWELTNTDTAPTCTENGVGDYTCMCGATNNDQPIPALGHEASEEYFILPGTPAVPKDPAVPDDQNTPDVDESIETPAVPSKHYNLCTRDGCTEKLNVSDHDWSNECDIKCDKCGETRTSEKAHEYKKAECQTKCSNCDFVRTDATVAHTYEHDCDVSCEECDETRETAGHQYTDCADAECNVDGCGQTRTAPGHAWDNACDNECNGCGIANPSYVAGHSYENCDDTTCDVCGNTREAVAHVYADCDATMCDTCGYTREAVAHVYDNACDANCNTCNKERTPAAHVYDNACDATCNVCAGTRTPAAHVYDDDKDATCNVCNAERQVADTTPDTTPDADNGDADNGKDGIGTGGVIGIVAGSIAVVGGGGFAAWWFIFKKKIV